MRLAFRAAAAAPLLLLVAGCARAAPPAAPAPLAPLESRLRTLLAAEGGDSLEVSVALLDLATGDSLLIDAHAPMHAASTMKVPVMLELFRRAEAGELSLDDPVPVRNEFRSIADGSPYALSSADDSDAELYARVGESLPLRGLMERMITRSSNLATNLLIERADPRRIAATLAEIGASEMRVLRGVEDTPAFERGMNNTTTAYGLMKVLEGIAAGKAVSPASTEAMLRILEGQDFREMIPAGLPPGTRVGNKTGWITGIHHDGAIVYPPGRRPYVLVVLTRGYRDTAAANRVAREVSRAVWEELLRLDHGLDPLALAHAGAAAVERAARLHLPARGADVEHDLLRPGERRVPGRRPPVGGEARRERTAHASGSPRRRRSAEAAAWRSPSIR